MRKHKLPDELALLTEDQLAEVEFWLDRFGYSRVQELFEQRHGYPISIGKLQRHFDRIKSARLHSSPAQAGTPPPLTAAGLVALRNGEPLPDDACLNYLKFQACQQAARKDVTPGKLKELMDIVTYTQRAELNARRAALNERFAELRARRQSLRERTMMPESSIPKPPKPR